MGKPVSHLWSVTVTSTKERHTQTNAKAKKTWKTEEAEKGVPEQQRGIMTTKLTEQVLQHSLKHMRFNPESTGNTSSFILKQYLK